MSSELEFKPCWACKYNDRGFPCRNADGSVNVELLAARYIKFCEKPATEHKGEDWWPFECLHDLADAAPAVTFRCVLSALPLCETDHQISVLAAGPLEELVRKHGPLMIADIERAAAADARFRYLLSGIWGGPHAEPEVWKRVQAAVRSGPWLDDDPRTPQGSEKSGAPD